MRRLLACAAGLLTLALAAGVAMAEDTGAEGPAAEISLLYKALASLAICVPAALLLLAGAWGISRVGMHGLDAIARQPEASGSMFLAWMIPAALIEGALLFGLLICMMMMNKILP